MKRSPSRYTTTPKRTKFHKKTEVCNIQLVHIAKLSTAVVKVNIKVMNSNSKSMFTNNV